MGTCASFLLPTQVRRKLEAGGWRKGKKSIISKMDFLYDSSDAEWLMGSVDDDQEGKIGLGRMIGLPVKAGSIFQLTSDLEEGGEDEEERNTGLGRTNSSTDVTSFPPPPLPTPRTKAEQDDNLANGATQQGGRMGGASLELSWEKIVASTHDTSLLISLDSMASSSGDWEIERGVTGEDSCFNSIPNSPEKLSPADQEDKRGGSGREKLQNVAKDKLGKFYQKFPPLSFQEDRVRLIVTDDEEEDDSESEVFFDFQSSVR